MVLIKINEFKNNKISLRELKYFLEEFENRVSFQQKEIAEKEVYNNVLNKITERRLELLKEGFVCDEIERIFVSEHFEYDLRSCAMKISGFYESSCTNGEGWRSVLFVSGCPHKCNGCHNEQTWDYDYGTPWRECKVDIKKKIYRNRLNQGITITGGEPFQERNVPHLLTFIEWYRYYLEDHGTDVWIYSGFTFEQLMMNKNFKHLLQKCDVLVDGKFIESLKTTECKFVGSSNQRIINVKESLEKGEVVLWK